MGATSNGNVATAASKQANLIIQTPPGAAAVTRRKLIQAAGPVTIPETYTVTAPTPGGTPSSVEVATGMISGVWSDDAGFDEMSFFVPAGFGPGDILDVTLAAGNLTVTINGAEVFKSLGGAATTGGILYYFA